MLADSADESNLVDALRAGARGYLMRRTPPQRILDGIRSVAKHETALDPRVAGQLVHYLDALNGTARPAGPAGPAGPGATSTPALGLTANQLEPEQAPATSMLTARQCTVAALVAEGLSNAEIARRLYLSQATVKSHLTIILRRLNLRDRTQLAIMVNRGATLGSP